jgi:hypothetical protein
VLAELDAQIETVRDMLARAPQETSPTAAAN